MGQNIFTKQQWQQVAADKLSGHESITPEEWKEILNCLWENLPPKFHSSVIKILEKNYKSDIDIL